MQGNVSAAEIKRSVRQDTLRAHKTLVMGRHTLGESSFHNHGLASSTFPVRLQVKGKALCVTSNYSQLLPIYTRGGTFYMALRLNKGLNWLNGLPRGRYVINNKQISIP